MPCRDTQCRSKNYQPCDAIAIAIRTSNIQQFYLWSIEHQSSVASETEWKQYKSRVDIVAIGHSHIEINETTINSICTLQLQLMQCVHFKFREWQCKDNDMHQLSVCDCVNV